MALLEIVLAIRNKHTKYKSYEYKIILIVGTITRCLMNYVPFVRNEISFWRN